MRRDKQRLSSASQYSSASFKTPDQAETKSGQVQASQPSERDRTVDSGPEMSRQHGVIGTGVILNVRGPVVEGHEGP